MKPPKQTLMLLSRRLLSRNAPMEATDEAAVKGDRLLITAKFSHDGHYLSEMDEEYVTLSDQVSFSDGICANFGEVLSGAMEGDTRTFK